MDDSPSLLITKKKQDTLFDRGFKSWCENTAVSIRAKMNLAPYSPLPPKDLAAKLGVIVCDLKNVPNIDQATVSHLISEDGDEWSAVTVTSGGKEIIVVNPTHSEPRQSSDLMHELAHIIKKHEAAQVFISELGYALRSFDEKQEAEADWFAGTLLLPRTVMAHCAYKKLTLQEVRDEYLVSKDLYEYRKRMTGISKQFRRAF